MRLSRPARSRSRISGKKQWSCGWVAFRSLEGPGLFFIIPIIETVPYWIDTRVITRSFKAEKILTKDTVPVDVNAVLFWKIIDPKKATLDVADYDSAISSPSFAQSTDFKDSPVLAPCIRGLVRDLTSRGGRRANCRIQHAASHQCLRRALRSHS